MKTLFNDCSLCQINPIEFTLMHRQFSHSTIWSLRLGSLHFIANIFVLILGAFLLTIGVITHADKYALYGFLGLSFGVLSVMVFKLCCSAITCPVCVSRIWANTGCRKHQKSKKFMGLSYRLRIAMKILTRQPYRCPYCAERFSSKNAIR